MEQIGVCERNNLMKADQVAACLGISVRKLWRMLAADQFPAAVQIGKRGTRWRERDIGEYINALGGRMGK